MLLLKNSKVTWLSYLLLCDRSDAGLEETGLCYTGMYICITVSTFTVTAKREREKNMCLVFDF